MSLVRKNAPKKRVVVARVQPLPRLFLPPTDVPVMRFRMQYTAATTASLSFYWMCLLTLMCVQKTTTTAVSLIRAARLRSVRVYLPPVIATSATGFVPPSVTVTIRDAQAVGLGAERRIVLTSSPEGRLFKWKPKGVMAEWINDDFIGATPAEIALSLSCTGVIPVIELDADIRFAGSVSMSGQTSPISFTTSATTAGAVNYLPLDAFSDFSTIGNNSYYPLGVSYVAPTSIPAFVKTPGSALPAMSSSSDVHVVGCRCQVCVRG